MKKHLTFKDEKSDKFWSIETSGTSFTVTYGKTGTEGQASTKSFDTEEKCMKEAEKLVSEKLKKGYVVSGETSLSSTIEPSDYMKEWEEIVKAKDLHKALAKHFSYLADSPGYEKFPEAIMEKATQASIENDALIIKFEEGDLIASAPGNIDAYKTWPKSFQKIISQHETLFYPEVGWALCLGDPGNFDSSFLTDESIQEREIRCPLGDFSDWWIYHPKRKNKLKESAICFVAHDDGEISDLSELNAGAIFLNRMKELLNIEIGTTSEKNKTSITSISLTPLVRLSRYVRKAYIHQKDLVTIEPKLAAEDWQYYPDAIHRIAIYDISNPKTPALKSFAPLQLTPRDMVIHGNLVYVFTLGKVEKETKFVISVFDISSHNQVVFVKELYSEVTLSTIDINSFVEESSLAVYENHLWFCLGGFAGSWDAIEKRRELGRTFDITVYDLLKGEKLLSHIVTEKWPNRVKFLDGGIFQFVASDDSNELRELTLKDNSVDTSQILNFEKWSGMFVYTIRGEHIFYIDKIKYKYYIICVDKKGKELSKTKYPGSTSINEMWVWNNVLIVDHGFFFLINEDGSIIQLKSNWKPKDSGMVNTSDYLTFDQHLLLIPKDSYDKTPGKEFEFQIMGISLH